MTADVCGVREACHLEELPPPSEEVSGCGSKLAISRGLPTSDQLISTLPVIWPQRGGKIGHVCREITNLLADQFDGAARHRKPPAADQSRALELPRRSVPNHLFQYARPASVTDLKCG